MQIYSFSLEDIFTVILVISVFALLCNAVVVQHKRGKQQTPEPIHDEITAGALICVIFSMCGVFAIELIKTI